MSQDITELQSLLLSLCTSVFTPLPFSMPWGSSLTLGLLRGLEDRPVEAPLTLRDLFPEESF